MLARSFLSAADLRITEAERDALIKTLHALERDEIPPHQFDMRKVEHGCGTPACLLGWANHFSGGTAFYTKGHSTICVSGWPQALKRLFAIHSYSLEADAATPAQAERALSNYLTTGDPRWAEAVA